MESSISICSSNVSEDNLMMLDLKSSRLPGIDLVPLIIKLVLLILELLLTPNLTQKFRPERSQLMKLTLSSSLTSVIKTTMVKSPWWNGEITTPLSLLALKRMITSRCSLNKLGTAEDQIDFKNEIFLRSIDLWQKHYYQFSFSTQIVCYGPSSLIKI